MKSEPTLRTTSAGRPTSESGARRDRRRQRKIAKVGMTLSMGALVATGLMRGHGNRTLHAWSGIALIGFSVWHHALYRPDASERRGASCVR